ncbi:MAG: STAS domain-containing protein [Syntrophorhabdaceae bacterium]|nr:STAS domain-containing protein [Syntrophorhabdaceae bacterium]
MDRFFMDEKNRKNINEKVLRFSGDLTVINAEKIKSQILHSIQDTDHLVLNLTDITDMDISFLQILCSAHKTALNSGKFITIDGDSFNTIKPHMERSGFFRHLGCSKDRKEECLFKG